MNCKIVIANTEWVYLEVLGEFRAEPDEIVGDRIEVPGFIRNVLLFKREYSILNLIRRKQHIRTAKLQYGKCYRCWGSRGYYWSGTGVGCIRLFRTSCTQEECQEKKQVPSNSLSAHR